MLASATQPGTPRRVAGPVLACLIALGAVTGILALFASAALAARSFDSKIPEFRQTSSIAIAPNDNVWITDEGHETSTPNPGQNGLYEYDSYPSQTLLDTPNTDEPWGSSILDLSAAVDGQSGDVYVAQSNGRTLDVFSEDGEFLEEWSNIDNTGGAVEAGIHVAIDNTNSHSKGRIYLSLSSPEDDVEVFDAGRHPVDFPATASYISANKLLGTPSGPFGEVQNVAVDSEGNVYVTDAEAAVVDEFDSTGTYLRSFKAPGAVGGNPGLGGTAIDPTNDNVLITTNSGVNEYDSSGNHLETLNASGARGTPGVNSMGYLYVPVYEQVDIFTPDAVEPRTTYSGITDPTSTAGTVNATVDPNGGGNVTECKFEYGEEAGKYILGSLPCEAGSSLPYSSKTEVSAGLSGLTTGKRYHYRLVVNNPNGVEYGSDQTYSPQAVLDLRTDPADQLGENGAELNGSFVGNGEDTSYYFEWGPTESYGQKTAPAPGADAGSPLGPGRSTVSASLSGLEPFSTYHYRVVASHGESGISYGEDRTFTTPPGMPSGRGVAATDVHSDRALLHGETNPNGAPTSARFQYISDEEFQKSGWDGAANAPAIEVGMSKHYQSVTQLVTGLAPGTLYHYRILGENEAGSGSSSGTFTTFGFIPSYNDPCANAHVRQQTGSSLLLDCRAYELVSVSNTGGYDVESNLVPGQMPFGGYPDAENPPQVLYGVHNGGIPGTGNPTNHGVDPYVATRGPNGWSTRYVGIPADATPSTLPFASPLLEADASLDTFAYGGDGICSPCFADGSTGTPLHLPSGELVQGMAGSIAQPSAEPSGFVAKHLSADGTHLIFGASQKFASGGQEGEISIYDRNLSDNQTQVVSNLPSGGAIPCLTNCASDGIGELGVSEDGSHIVVGQLVEETGGARYWHLYMDIGDSEKSLDLTPGSKSGVLFDGMTKDGSRVFFTTAEQLTAEDKDHSPDIYEAHLSGQGVQLRLVSAGENAGNSGEPGNSDSCEPSANTRHEHWNTTGSEANCGVVAIGGGSGVAEEGDSIYFLSPERLTATGGVENAPNLYVADPTPHFIATLESSSNAPLPPSTHPLLRSFGAFVNPGGVAIDRATGDIYVSDIENNIGPSYVYKFDSSGRPVLSFGAEGKITLSGAYGYYNLSTEIAVDNDPSSPNYGDLYVPQFLNRVVSIFDPSGAHLADISMGSNFPAGVAVDPATGELFVADGFFGSSVSVYSTKGVLTRSFPTIAAPTSIAVDSSGNAYVADGGGYLELKGVTEKYNPAGEEEEQVDGNPSYGVAVDPSDNHLYVDEGTQVSEFNASGETASSPTGAGLISASFGVAALGGKLAISNPSQTDVATFGPGVLPSDPNTDNPAVVDSVGSPAARETADFQLNSSGNDAVFTSTLPLTGYDSAANREVFRYQESSAELSCASCNPTGEQAIGQATLASDGSSLTEDGRVFFNSTEGLVDRDLNEKMDVYEWEPRGSEAVEHAAPCATQNGCVQLISTGTSPLDSSLLGVSADGIDAYFFTHDTLVSSDGNGSRVKIYDAREGGGFDEAPPEHQCQASDECHGAGSPEPSPSAIRTIAGSGGQNPPAVTCRPGYVKRHGRCIKKRPKHGRRHHRQRHRGSHVHSKAIRRAGGGKHG